MLPSTRTPIVVAALSVLSSLTWIYLDANPSLFLYDAYLTAFRSVRAPPPSSVGGGGVGRDVHRRRALRVPTRFNSNTTAWITGASSGIGAELAVQLVDAGVGHVIISARREQKLNEVADLCRARSEAAGRNLGYSSKVSVLPVDLTGPPPAIDDAVRSALALARSDSDNHNGGSGGGGGGIDILILNAGRYQCSPALDTDADMTAQIMHQNFLSSVALSTSLMKADSWKERGRGHLVVTSSLMGRGPSALNGPYAATKHAIRGYYHTLAAEERSWLRVDVPCPGATDTELWESAAAAASPKHSEKDAGVVVVEGSNGEVSSAVQTNDKVDERSSPLPLRAHDGAKMSAVRCAQLIVSGMVGPNALTFETWITKNPGLLWVFVCSYMPTTFRLMNHVIGWLRMDMYHEDGSDPLYLPDLLRHLAKKVVR